MFKILQAKKTIYQIDFDLLKIKCHSKIMKINQFQLLVLKIAQIIQNFNGFKGIREIDVQKSLKFLGKY